MGRIQLRQVIRALGLTACLAGGGGCITVQTDAEGRLKSVSVGEPPAIAKSAEPKAGDPKVDPAVQQAAAKVPTASITSVARAAIKDLPRGSAAEISVGWQNKVAQLPDPTRNGALIHGVVGQMFLFTSDFKPAEANGQLVVEMYDITRQPNEENRLGTWTFDKDTLKRLVTMDERFGKCYALFLPWPEYNPQVGRVKLKVRFDPERGGYPLFAKESPLTFDNEFTAAFNKTQTTNPIGVPAGFAGLPASAPAAPRPLPPLDPLPVGGRNSPVAPAGPPVSLPPNLPSLVITPNR